MQTIHSAYSASISDLKVNPSALLQQADGEAIAILHHNRTSAYFVPAETYEALLERLDDLELAQLARERAHEKPQAITVSIDDL